MEEKIDWEDKIKEILEDNMDANLDVFEGETLYREGVVDDVKKLINQAIRETCERLRMKKIIGVDCVTTDRDGVLIREGRNQAVNELNKKIDKILTS